LTRIFLIDGNSYVYRAFFATPHLSNSKGMPTNAIYAFISMIRKLQNEQKPDRLVVIFDSRGPSFRKEISSEYKATRPPMPSNMSVQFPYIKQVVDKMGIPIIEKEGFEADDIIASFVARKVDEDAQIFIVTSDKDMMQVVSGKVFIFDSMKNKLIGEGEVVEKFGVGPCLVPDFLALAGDASDNIPGAPGIGEKTARDLVSNFGSIEQLYKSIDQISKPAIRQKLIDNRDLVAMSRELAVLRTDVPLDIDLENLHLKEPDLQGLKRLYRDLELTSLYKEIKVEPEEQREWIQLRREELADKDLALLARIYGRCAEEMTLDGFACSDGKGVYYSDQENELFSSLTASHSIVTHNLKPLFVAARKNGRSIIDQIFDTMLAAYLINPLRKEYGLDSLLGEYLDVELEPADGKGGLTSRVPYLLELKERLAEHLENLSLSNLYFDIELPLVEVLADMECFGVRVDRSMLAELSRDFDKRLTAIMKVISDMAGETFNINSPQQLARILFQKIGLQPVKKTKTSFSTDNEVLQILAERHPLPKEILEYRMLQKLKGTYVDALHTLINPKTGRIHASFNQMVVATGRLSSSDPNLQNIPIKGVEGRKIRAAFIPADGFLLLSSDYSQIELRVLAHLSEDELLREAFRNDEDIHTKVAQEVFRVEESLVSQEMRRTAKVINFGIVYGISGYGLSKELGVSPRESQLYIDAYFERHTGIRAYIEGTIAEAREKGCVRTLFGRIRAIPEIHNHDANIRQFGERTAMNSPVQGTAADIIKKAMIAIHKKIREKELRSRLILQIHDELVFEVAEEEVNLMKELVRYEMEHACELTVPLKVSTGIGRNWAEAHE
jgi:DNA polymerase I